MSANRQEDPLRLYRALDQAVINWHRENAGRFVVPGREHWPDTVGTREEAIEHYGKQATDDIAARMEVILTEEAEQ